jgi:hypothetical protein
MKSAATILHLGLDVHKESIAVAIAASDESVRPDGEIPGHSQAVDRLLIAESLKRMFIRHGLKGVLGLNHSWPNRGRIFRSDP